MQFFKSITSLHVISLIITVSLSACDYVSNPYLPKTITTIDSGYATGKGDETRHVLIEDYTGHKCDNCPQAARDLLAQINAKGLTNKAIVIGIHSGSFANTVASGGEQFPTDMRTADGTIYDNTFGISKIGNPNFTFNRKINGANGSRAFGSGDFGSGFDTSQVGKPADFRIDMLTTYNASNRTIEGRVKATALKALSGGLYKIIILLIEDSVIAEQLDKHNIPGQNYYPNYVHRHVLRGAINTTWGTPVYLGKTALILNDTASVAVSGFTVDNKFNDKHCYVVAYIYNANTSVPDKQYEVFQVEERKLK